MRLSLICLLCLPSLATAQDADPAPRNGISFTFGAGVESSPGYFGAPDNEVGVAGEFDLDRLQFGPLSRDGEEKYGLSFGGSGRMINERSSDDYDELEGLEDVDLALEIGGEVEYLTPNYKVFGQLRYGVLGHESLVAELGGDVFYRPTDQITLSAGPRLLWGSDDYAQTYFGVTADESLASGFDAFDAQGGLMSAGVEMEARYQFNDDWGLIGKVRYEQLRDDAADSPISAEDDQVTASLVLTRFVSFGF